MKAVKTTLAALMCSSALVLSAPANAKTPDGWTPAVETICSAYSGALFGLCNAICEAQDLDQFPKDPTSDVLNGNFEKKGGEDLICRGEIPE